jgi:hypothetical protein
MVRFADVANRCAVSTCGLLADTRVVAEDARRAADNRAGKGAAAHGIGNDRAAGRTGKTALRIIGKAPGQRRNKCNRRERFDIPHSALPPSKGFIFADLSEIPPVEKQFRRAEMVSAMLRAPT